MAFGFSCFSIISLWGTYLRHSFSAAGLSAQTIDIDDETTIHFWGPKSPDPANPKPPLVLLHGFGPDAHWQWNHQVAFFAREFALYIPNLVFFGDSTTKSTERSEMFQAVSVGKLMEKLGVKRYYVVGTSYGGYVAYHMAAMWPERVEKVVIASSAVNMKRRDNVEFLEKRAKVENGEELLLPQTEAQLRALLALAGYRGHNYMPDFLLKDIVRVGTYHVAVPTFAVSTPRGTRAIHPGQLKNMYSKNRKEKIELLKGLHVGNYDTVKISPLPQDVFLVWGEHDQLFLLEKATELKGLLGEKTKLEVIKKTGHAPQVENPAQFNKIVYKLLVG